MMMLGKEVEEGTSSPSKMKSKDDSINSSNNDNEILKNHKEQLNTEKSHRRNRSNQTSIQLIAQNAGPVTKIQKVCNVSSTTTQYNRHHIAPTPTTTMTKDMLIVEKGPLIDPEMQLDDLNSGNSSCNSSTTSSNSSTRLQTRIPENSSTNRKISNNNPSNNSTPFAFPASNGKFSQGCSSDVTSNKSSSSKNRSRFFSRNSGSKPNAVKKNGSNPKSSLREHYSSVSSSSSSTSSSSSSRTKMRRSAALKKAEKGKKKVDVQIQLLENNPSSITVSTFNSSVHDTDEEFEDYNLNNRTENQKKSPDSQEKVTKPQSQGRSQQQRTGLFGSLSSKFSSSNFSQIVNKSRNTTTAPSSSSKKTNQNNLKGKQTTDMDVTQMELELESASYNNDDKYDLFDEESEVGSSVHIEMSDTSSFGYNISQPTENFHVSCTYVSETVARSRNGSTDSFGSVTSRSRASSTSSITNNTISRPPSRVANEFDQDTPSDNALFEEDHIVTETGNSSNSLFPSMQSDRYSHINFDSDFAKSKKQSSSQNMINHPKNGNNAVNTTSPHFNSSSEGNGFKTSAARKFDSSKLDSDVESATEAISRMDVETGNPKLNFKVHHQSSENSTEKAEHSSTSTCIDTESRKSLISKSEEISCTLMTDDGGVVDTPTTSIHLSKSLRSFSYTSVRNEYAILPPQDGEHKGRIAVVLDIDETLVHSRLPENSPLRQREERVDTSGSCYSGEKFELQLSENETFLVHIRPGLAEFLEFARENFEVIAYTAAIEEYAIPLLNRLDPNGTIFRHRLFRQDCVWANGHFVKDLRKVNRDLERTVLVDNNAYCFLPQLSNGIPISGFYDDANDSALRVLRSFLRSLNAQPSVLPTLRDTFHLEQLLAQHRAQVLGPDWDNIPPHLLLNGSQFM